ncbi:MAG: UDP-2,3-diacylglucosamine diphosphatase LpxI [Desulfobulbaceae bacterium]|nr:UDP-2,3-diacylglucosamine diphosphatase LpxI [Desulfobulbaceae bacterium]
MEAPIGIVAGGGQFPLLFIEAARKRGKKVIAIGHSGESLPELAETADVTYWVKLGQLGKIIKYFRKENVQETVFAGTITKTRIFKDILPDIKGLSLWNKIDARQDDAILRAVASALEEEGIKVLASTCYLKHLLFPKGVLTKKKPTAAQMEDIRFGWHIAKEIGRLDIGQSVVVRDRSVLAVEAIDGTDATIRRGGKLANNNAIVVKVKKPTQDFRFDLPATGAQTIEIMQSVKGSVLAVEAGHALIFDQQALITAADRAGIVVVGLEEDEAGQPIYE